MAEEMNVGDVMTRGVETAREGDTLQAAAETMRAKCVGLLVVVRNGEPVGVLTDRDVTVRATALGRDPARTTVGEVMTAQVYSCALATEIEDAARLMEQRAVRRLIVLDDDGHPAGVISVDDIAARVRDEELAGEILRRAAEPSVEAP